MTSPLFARACGVDFGTSNSTAAWWRPGQDSLLALENGAATLPSVVFFNAELDSHSYGRAALAEYLEGYEGRLMRSLKSLLGSRLMDEQTEVAGRSLAFRELLRCFIGEIKRRAEQQAGRAFDTVVLGRPVHFVDDDKVADQVAEDTLRDIAHSVGWREVSFQLEPIAAAYHFEQSMQREALVLVVDVGGGTSDFSLLRLSPQRAQCAERHNDLLAHAGVHIGGTDFDQRLSLAGVMPSLGYQSRLKNNAVIPSSYYLNLATWHTINRNYSRKMWAELQDVAMDVVDRPQFDRLLRLIQQREGHALAMQVEAAKMALSQQAHARVDLTAVEPDLHLELSRLTFEAAIATQVAQISQALRQMLQQAQIAASAVQTLFFTGGSSGVPLLRQQVAEQFPQAEVVEGDLFGSIGAGLAVEAWRRYGA